MSSTEATPDIELPPGVKRRQPAVRKGDQTEQALLDSLERLVEERAIAAISIDDIAAGAGVSRATFYSYFPSKLAALTVRFHRLLAELRPLSTTFAEAIRSGDRAQLVAAARPLSKSWCGHFGLLRAALESLHVDAELADLWRRWMHGMIDETAPPDGAAGREGPYERAAISSLIWACERTVYEHFRVSRSEETQEDVAQVIALLAAGTTAQLAADRKQAKA